MRSSKLTVPIPGPVAVGVAMTFSPEFDAIEEARRADDPSLSQGEWTRSLKAADWPLALRLTETLLTEKTKDLRVAGWYVEARSHVHGFEGLAEGLGVVASLCESFWDDIHPADDDEERAGCLRWLVAQATPWIRGMPLDDTGASSLSSLVTAHGARVETSAEQLRLWRAGTDRIFLARLQGFAEAALASLGRLEACMHRHLGADAPSTAGTSQALRDVIDLARPQDDARSPDPSAIRVQHSSLATGKVHHECSFASREAAIAALRDVAAYFRTTEPHSPVAYLADKAARWGDMPLDAWLTAVLGEGDSLKKMRELLDIPKGDA